VLGWLRYRTRLVTPDQARFDFAAGGWPVFVRQAAEHGYTAIPFCSWLRGAPSFSWERPDKVRFARDGLICDMDMSTVEQSAERLWSYLDRGFDKALAVRG
jgi:hypothetical protein